jgi:hypothetical protein
MCIVLVQVPVIIFLRPMNLNILDEVWKYLWYSFIYIMSTKLGRMLHLQTCFVPFLRIFCAISVHFLCFLFLAGMTNGLSVQPKCSNYKKLTSESTKEIWEYFSNGIMFWIYNNWNIIVANILNILKMQKYSYFTT